MKDITHAITPPIIKQKEAHGIHVQAVILQLDNLISPVTQADIPA